MRSVLFVGNTASAELVAALESDGFVVLQRAPGDPEPIDVTKVEVVIIDLTAAGEQPAVKQLLESPQAQSGAAVIVILNRDQIVSYDPSKEIDDFVLAGASSEELLARVRQVIWKRHRLDTRNVLKCGDLVIDLANYTVHVAGRPVDLTYKEYELLRFLATNRDRVFTREVLLNKVWGYDFYGGARTVDVHVRRLRAKIEDRHNRFIETVRNVGYRFRVMG
jgi:DNA-binding response OmpR family regulator